MKNKSILPLIVISAFAIVLKLKFYPQVLLHYGILVLLMKLSIIYVECSIQQHRSLKKIIRVFDWVYTIVYLLTIMLSIAIGWIQINWDTPKTYLMLCVTFAFDLLTFVFFELSVIAIRNTIRKNKSNKVGGNSG